MSGREISDVDRFVDTVRKAVRVGAWLVAAQVCFLFAGTQLGCSSLHEARERITEITQGVDSRGDDRRPPGGYEAEQLPWGSWDKVTMVRGPNPGAWAVTMQIANARIGQYVTWEGVAPDAWPELCDGCNAATFVAWKHQERWYGAISELVPRRGQLQTYDVFKSRDGCRFDEPFRTYKYDAATAYHFGIVSAKPAWGEPGPLERSNIVPMQR